MIRHRVFQFFPYFAVLQLSFCCGISCALDCVFRGWLQSRGISCALDSFFEGPVVLFLVL